MLVRLTLTGLLLAGNVQAQNATVVLSKPSAECTFSAVTSTLNLGSVSLPYPLTGQSGTAGVSVNNADLSDNVEAASSPSYARFTVRGRNVSSYTVAFSPTTQTLRSGAATLTAHIHLGARAQDTSSGSYAQQLGSSVSGTAGGARTSFYRDFSIGGAVTIPSSFTTLGTFTAQGTASATCS